MQTNMCVPLIMRPHVLQALVTIRKGWEEAAEGDSLVDIRGSVGLLFSDFVGAIGLTQQEKEQVLGTKLSCALQDMDAIGQEQ
jgi:hypothetical protein